MYLCGFFSLLLLIFSVVLLATRLLQTILEQGVKQEMVLKNGSEAFAAWEDPPPPIYMEFYFFNVSNPAEVLQGETPAVREKGPYTYREYRPKTEVIFLDNGTKVSSFSPKTYVFVPELSVGDPKRDLIRTVNIPVVAAMEQLKDKPERAILSAILKTTGEGLFMTRTIDDLLWGYKDAVLSLLFLLHPEKQYFGLFYGMNETDDGRYVILTGEQDYHDFARITEWKDNATLHWWTSDICNMINGTDGASFHPLITKKEKLYMFSSDLCRSVYAIFERTVIMKGVTAFRFVLPPDLFANASINPDNAGFCVPYGNCLGSGVLNVSLCKQNAPIILSSPHFYQGDQKFIDDIFGMHPTKEKHETYLDINPLTGILVKAAKRLQVNVHIQKIAAFSETGNVRTLIFPVMYINENVLIDDGSARKLKAVMLLSKLLTAVPFVILAFGILLGIIFIAMAYTQHRRPQEEGTSDEKAPLIPAS